MRWVIAAVALVIAGAAAAQPVRHYDLYIYDAGGDAADVYAIAAGNRSASLEVRGCGDVTLDLNAQALVADLRAQRRTRDDTVIVISGRNSRTELGPCAADTTDDGDEQYEGVDDGGLVVIENMSASQARRTLRTLDAAPADIREQMLSAVGL